MKEFTNKKLGFAFYIDDWADHTCEKVRVYDSDREMIDYFEEENVFRACEKYGMTPQEVIDKIGNYLADADTIKIFLSAITDKWCCAYEEDEDNGWCNHLGKYIVEIL